jgi:excisionase family DNA binding protein
MAASPDEIMTIDEMASYLKVSKSTLYKLVQHGGLPAQKVGKQWRFHKSAVDDWFRQRPARDKGTVKRDR